MVNPIHVNPKWTLISWYGTLLLPSAKRQCHAHFSVKPSQRQRTHLNQSSRLYSWTKFIFETPSSKSLWSVRPDNFYILYCSGNSLLKSITVCPNLGSRLGTKWPPCSKAPWWNMDRTTSAPAATLYLLASCELPRRLAKELSVPIHVQENIRISQGYFRCSQTLIQIL